MHAGFEIIKPTSAGSAWNAYIWEDADEPGVFVFRISEINGLGYAIVNPDDYPFNENSYFGGERDLANEDFVFILKTTGEIYLKFTTNETEFAAHQINTHVELTGIDDPSSYDNESQDYWHYNKYEYILMKDKLYSRLIGESSWNKFTIPSAQLTGKIWEKDATLEDYYLSYIIWGSEIYKVFDSGNILKMQDITTPTQVYTGHTDWFATGTKIYQLTNTDITVKALSASYAWGVAPSGKITTLQTIAENEYAELYDRRSNLVIKGWYSDVTNNGIIYNANIKSLAEIALKKRIESDMDYRGAAATTQQILTDLVDNYFDVITYTADSIESEGATTYEPNFTGDNAEGVIKWVQNRSAHVVYLDEDLVIYKDDGTHTSGTLDYDNESAAFTVGSKLTGGNSAATAIIKSIVDNGTDGTLTLKNVKGTFEDDEEITDADGGTADVDGTLTQDKFSPSPTSIYKAFSITTKNENLAVSYIYYVGGFVDGTRITSKKASSLVGGNILFDSFPEVISQVELDALATERASLEADVLNKIYFKTSGVSLINYGRTVKFEFLPTFSITEASYFVMGLNYNVLADIMEIILYDKLYFPQTSEEKEKGGVTVSTNQNLIEDLATTVEAGGGGGGLANIVEDLTPQLGGTLDTNGHPIEVKTTDKVQFRDAAVYIQSADDGHLDATADTSIDLNTPIVSLGTTDRIQLRDAAIYVNSADDGHLDMVADTSIDLNTPIVSLGTTDRIQFRDAAIHVESADDGHLDITADTSIDLNGPVATPNQITSSLAIGTKPLNITSTTLCDNLNADLLDGNEAAAFAPVSHTQAESTITNTGTANTVIKTDHTKLVNGTLVDNSGALSAITTLSMNNQLTNTLAIGTKPLVITSTTMNDNLNADLLDGSHATAFLPVAIQVAGTFTAGSCYYYDGDSWELAGNDTLEELDNRVVGYCAATDVLTLFGKVTKTGHGFALFAPLYVSTHASGHILTTSIPTPSTLTAMKRMGFAIDVNTLFINGMSESFTK